jgi:hypothetical protein
VSISRLSEGRRVGCEPLDVKGGSSWIERADPRIKMQGPETRRQPTCRDQYDRLEGKVSEALDV